MFVFRVIFLKNISYSINELYNTKQNARNLMDLKHWQEIKVGEPVSSTPTCLALWVYMKWSKLKWTFYSTKIVYTSLNTNCTVEGQDCAAIYPFLISVVDILFIVPYMVNSNSYNSTFNIYFFLQNYYLTFFP